MFNERDSFMTRHEIILNGLTCHKTQLFNQSKGKRQRTSYNSELLKLQLPLGVWFYLAIVYRPKSTALHPLDLRLV